MFLSITMVERTASTVKLLLDMLVASILMEVFDVETWPNKKTGSNEKVKIMEREGFMC